MKPERIVVLGAGGHAKVVVDLLLAAREYDLIGCLSRSASEPAVLGVPVLGSEELLPRLVEEHVRCAFVAIGDNRVRARLSSIVHDAGLLLCNVVSPHAAVSHHARLGQGIVIMPGAVVNAEASIGDGAIINTGATVDHDCRVGAFAHIAPGSSLAGNVEVGEGTMLGVGCRAIPGVVIGAWSMVGAGSVIVRNLPDRCTALGVPARVQKRAATE